MAVKKQDLDVLDQLEVEIAEKKATDAFDGKDAAEFIPSIEDRIASLEKKIGGTFLHDNVTYKFPKEKIERLKTRISEGALPNKRFVVWNNAVFLVDREPEVDTNLETEVSKVGPDGKLTERNLYKDITGAEGEPLTPEEMKRKITI